MNKDRPWLRSALNAAITILGAFLAIRFGIPPGTIPPIPAPPPQVQPAPPVPIPTPPENQGKPDTFGAIGRITFGSAGCTATIIGPRRPDGRWNVLTASHCVNGVGARGTMTLKDGRRTGLLVTAFDPKADCAWAVTDTNSEAYPFALLADYTPDVGTKVWHAGYGVDKPGNREDGELTAGPDSNGQIQFSLSVSSGDSGGAIVQDSNGRVLSCVCCTSARGTRARVWGAGPAAIARLLPTDLALDGWVPLPVPIRKE